MMRDESSSGEDARAAVTLLSGRPSGSGSLVARSKSLAQGPFGWAVATAATIALLVVVAFYVHENDACRLKGRQSDKDANIIPKVTNKVKFGKEMRSHFLLAEDLVNLNHGSFGAPPAQVLAAQRNYVDIMERRPDDWFRGDRTPSGGYQAILAKVRPKLADYIGAKTSDVAFVENASSAVNAVLRSLTYAPGDAILVFSTAYNMVKHTAEWLAETRGVRVITMPVVFPATVGSSGIPDYVQILEDTLAQEANTTIRIAVFSHISSVPAVIMPIAELATVCKSHGIPVFSDGAHCLGQIPINMTALGEAGVTYYCGNAHKWLYGVKGSCFLWVRPQDTWDIVPTVVSSAADLTAHDFQQIFEYTGTRDYTPFCAIADALEFRETIGDQKIMDFMHEFAVWTGDYLSTTWGTQVLLPSEYIGAMVNVQLPPGDASGLWDYLNNEMDIVIVVYQPAYGDGSWWCRISCQIYNTHDEIKLMADTVSAYLLEHP